MGAILCPNRTIERECAVALHLELDRHMIGCGVVPSEDPCLDPGCQGETDPSEDEGKCADHARDDDRGAPRGAIETIALGHLRGELVLSEGARHDPIVALGD